MHTRKECNSDVRVYEHMAKGNIGKAMAMMNIFLLGCGNVLMSIPLGQTRTRFTWKYFLP